MCVAGVHVGPISVNGAIQSYMPIIFDPTVNLGKSSNKCVVAAPIVLSDLTNVDSGFDDNDYGILIDISVDDVDMILLIYPKDKRKWEKSKRFKSPYLGICNSERTVTLYNCCNTYFNIQATFLLVLPMVSPTYYKPTLSSLYTMLYLYRCFDVSLNIYSIKCI